LHHEVAAFIGRIGRVQQPEAKEYASMKLPLVAAALVLAATAAQAQTRYVIGSASMPRDAQTDPLGPRSAPTVTVAAAVARTQIEKAGYTGVRGLQRMPDGVWHAAARDSRNAPVAVTLDNQGNVSQSR
jgi:hypothetical protein